MDLLEVGGRLRKALSDSATGPLVIAAEIVQLSEAWDQVPDPVPVTSGSSAMQAERAASLREQAGGSSCDAWVRAKVAPGGLAFFTARHKAIERIGEAARRTVHHEVAVWVDRHVSDAQLGEVKQALMRGAKAQNGSPLTKAQAMRVLAKLLGLKPKAHGCSRCEQLEKVLRESGLEVPE